MESTSTFNKKKKNADSEIIEGSVIAVEGIFLRHPIFNH